MPDTIKAETTLIEEDALMAESLRVESEPWTRFYLAGEIIRESRKASGKQSKYGSEGNTAHSDEMIEHYDHPRNVGSHPKDDPNGSISRGWSRRRDRAPDEDQFRGASHRGNGEQDVGCGSATAGSSLPAEFGQRARARESAGHQEHEYRPRDQSSPQPCSMRQDTPELEGGYNLVGSPIS